MKPVKFLLVVAFLAGITPAFAQKKDPVEIYGAGKDIVNMRTFQDPVSNSKEWVRADVILRGIVNPDKTATDEREKRWIRDVSLDITVVYVPAVGQWELQTLPFDAFADRIREVLP